jgi:hypothetical protein
MGAVQCSLEGVQFIAKAYLLVDDTLCHPSSTYSTALAVFDF